MAEPFMSPRSSVYSGGDLVPYQERAYIGSAPGATVGTESQAANPAGGGGGFLAGLERFAGAINPIVEAAVAFKRGYDTGLPLPGRFGGNRMAGQEFIFQALEDLRARNERASEEAREERESARRRDLKTQVLIKAYENKEISLEDLMKGIETGDLSGLGSTEKLPSQQPVATPQAAPTSSSTGSNPPAPAAPIVDTRVSEEDPKIRYGEDAVDPRVRGYI